MQWGGKIKKLLYILIAVIFLTSVAALPIDDLIASYDYSFSDGSVGVLSYSDSMSDSDLDGVNDRLEVSIDVESHVPGEYTLYVYLEDGPIASKVFSEEESILLEIPTTLLTGSSWIYSVEVYNEQGIAVYREYNLTTGEYDTYNEGLQITNVSLGVPIDLSVSDVDGDVYEGIDVLLTINATMNQTTNITAFLQAGDTIVSKTQEETLIEGTQFVLMQIDHELIKQTHHVGDFSLTAVEIDDKSISSDAVVEGKSYHSFAHTSYISSFLETTNDDDENGLIDALTVTANIMVKEEGEYTLKGSIYTLQGTFVRDFLLVQELEEGEQTIPIEIPGEQLYKLYRDESFSVTYVELFDELGVKIDYIEEAYTTETYSYATFERPPLPDLVPKIHQEGDTVVLTVQNVGETIATNVFVDFFDNETILFNETIPFLDVGEETLIEFPLDEEQTYIAFVDLFNIVDEGNEENNIAIWPMVYHEGDILLTGALISENLEILNLNSVDPEGSLIKNIVHWFRNEESITLLSLLFEADDPAHDYSGTGIASRVQGATWDATAGHDGFGAAIFDGRNDQIDLNDPLLIDLTRADAFTVSLWFKANPSAINTLTLLSQEDGDGTGRSWMFFGRLPEGCSYETFRTYLGGSILCSETLIEDEQWYHAVLTYDGEDLVMYLNGEEEARDTRVINEEATGKLVLGESKIGKMDFDGIIDDVQFFSVALTFDQVRALYQGRHVMTASMTSIGEEWSVEVAENNGEGDIAHRVSETITISPSPIVPIIEPSAPDVDDTLTLTFLENEDMKYIINWLKNDESISLLHLPFEAGDTTRDYSGHDIEPIVQNAVWNSNIGYDGFGAYAFDGRNDQIDLNDLLLIGLTRADAFTVSLRFKGYDTPHNTVALLSQEDGDGTGRSWMFYGRLPEECTPETFRTYLGGSILCSETLIEDEQWYHATLTYDGTELVMYLDGEEEARDTRTIDEGATGKLVLGESKIGKQDLNGVIDEVLFFDVALTPSQVESLYYDNMYVIAPDMTSTDQTWQAQVTVNDNLASEETYFSNIVSTPPGIYTGDYVACYDFDNSLDDATGVYNAALGSPMYTSGKNGNALDLRTITAPVDTTLDFNPVDGFTIEGWVFIEDDACPGSCRIWDTWHGAGMHEMLFIIGNSAYDGKMFSILEKADDGVDQQLYSLTDSASLYGSWHHIAYIYDGDTQTIYIDAILDNSAPVAGPVHDAEKTIWFGERDLDWFSGMLDSIAIYERPLLAEELMFNYNEGFGRACDVRGVAP